MKPLIEEKITVLAGGPSCERAISLLSGQAVYEALRSQGLAVRLMDPDDTMIARLKKDGTTAVFIALHGAFGEDGTVQAMLDEAGIPYTGSDAKASRIAFDKSESQRLFQKAGLVVPDFTVLEKPRPLPARQKLKLPVVVKPSSCGSSVGVTIVRNPEEFSKAVDLAFTFSERVLVERYIEGRELTVGILDDQPLPIVEVIAQRKFYDYEAKYRDSGTRYEFPAKLSAEEAEKVSSAALRAYQVLGCLHFARTDVILANDGTPYVLEVNTIPGLTSKSLLPKAAKAQGIDFPDLCVKIIELARGRVARPLVLE